LISLAALPKKLKNRRGDWSTGHLFKEMRGMPPSWTPKEVRYDRNDDSACGTGILREFMSEQQIGLMQDIEKIERQNFVTTGNPRYIQASDVTNRAESLTGVLPFKFFSEADRLSRFEASADRPKPGLKPSANKKDPLPEAPFFVIVTDEASNSHVTQAAKEDRPCASP
jgi:hypothetical protein